MSVFAFDPPSCMFQIDDAEAGAEGWTFGTVAEEDAKPVVFLFA